MTDYLQSLFQRADIGQSRSAITNPLQWAIAILIAGIVLLWRAGAPTWILAVPVIFLGLFLVLFIGAYVYFAVKDPVALRSEHFALSKIAIEHGLMGDSISGLIDESKVLPPEKNLLLGKRGEVTDEASLRGYSAEREHRAAERRDQIFPEQGIRILALGC